LLSDSSWQSIVIVTTTISITIIIIQLAGKGGRKEGRKEGGRGSSL
jgi:hypothetical protein